MTKTGVRRYEIDLLRIVAATGVVAFHVTYGNQILGFNPVKYPSAITAVAKYGFLAVPLFFFISGFVILKSAGGRSARRFATSRIVRLYPAYWACVTATFLLVNILGTRRIPISDYLINMTMLEGFLLHPLVDAVYWTLQVELIFYGIIWLTLATKQMKRITTVMWAWLGVCALTTAVQVAGHGVPNRIVVATGYSAYFVVGAAAYLYRNGDKRRTVITMLAAASGLSLFRAYFDTRSERAMYHTINVNMGVVVVAVLLVIFLVAAFDLFPRVGRPWMSVAAVLTYPVYLLHDEFSNVLYTRWHTLNRWLLLVVVLAIVLAASWIVHVAIENPLAPRLRAALNRGWDRVPTTRAGRGDPVLPRRSVPTSGQAPPS